MKFTFVILLLATFTLYGCPDPSQSNISSTPAEPEITTPNFTTTAKQSDYICRGTITSIKTSRQQLDAQINSVMSDVFIKITKTYKGNLGEEASIRAFGGYLDGTDYYSTDMPRFQVGEDTILFLSNFDGGIFTTNHSAGKLTIINNSILETGQTVQEFESLLLPIVTEN